MIKGIGIDMCCVSRMEKAILNPGFMERVFTVEELQYSFDRTNRARHFASAFAAKEAFAKAGGWGIGRVGLKNVWLTRSSSGPSLSFSSHALSLIDSLGAVNIHVSVTHEADLAVAVVVMEG